MNPLKAPLNETEIRQAVSVVQREAGLDPSAWFETISLDESGQFADQRGAYVCCYEPASNRTLTGIVLLESDELRGWRHIEGVQARILPDEFAMACELARKHEGFLQALRKRGLDDASKVLIESWSAGNFGSEEEQNKRIAYGHCWLMNDAGDNPYARPIANLHPVFDLAAREIIRVDDFGVVPIPPDPGPIRRPQQRQDLKDISITQPDGPSFEVDGYHVKWHDWELQIGFAQRDGLVLYDIGFNDKGRLRPIMKRAAMAEMVVPYGDPRGANFRRNAFDTGEYGIGASLDSLTLGCDCLGYIRYFDIWTHDWHGEPRLIKNAVCMHEVEILGADGRPDHGNALAAPGGVVDRHYRQLRLRFFLVLLHGRRHRRRSQSYRDSVPIRARRRQTQPLRQDRRRPDRIARAPARVQLPFRHGARRRT
jgi:primary-amine oxidase